MDQLVDPERFYRNFLAAAAAAPSQGYRVYWLGRQFTAGGLVFTGPSVGGFDPMIKGGGLVITYSAPIPGMQDAAGGPRVALYLSLHSRNAWQAVEARARGEGDPDYTHRNVTVADHQGELISILPGRRSITQLRLILDLGDTVIKADADAGGSVTPGGPDLNPLIYESTLLSVMDQIRPYPD